MKRSTLTLMLLALVATVNVNPTTASQPALEAPEVSQVSLADGPVHPMAAPLSPDDPAAMVDPDMFNVPAATPPRVRPDVPAGEAIPTGELVYDVERGTTAEVEVDGADQRGRKILDGELGSVAPEGDLAYLDVDAHKVFGADNRTLVTNPTAFPNRTFCKIIARYPNGASASGTGTLIGRRHLLTAGHVAFSHENGGFATRMEVIPALSGSTAPFGRAFASVISVDLAWSQLALPSDDYARVRLDRNIGDTTGFLGFSTISNPNGVNVRITGYPGDLGGGTRMFTHAGPINLSVPTNLFYTIDTAPGQSGSGIVRTIGTTRVVVGVHTLGTDLTNSGVRIDNNKFNILVAFRNS